MRAKTEVQRLVNQLSERLQEPTEKQYRWAFKTQFWHYIYITKAENTCLSCNHEWKNDIYNTCPSCKNPLKTLDGKKRTQKDSAYFSIYETIEGFQVLRTFYIKRYLKAGYKAFHDIKEVYQHWISPQGKQVVRATLVNGFSYGYYDGWSPCAPLEIRNPHDRYFLRISEVCPGRKILKNIRRNGFKGNYHDIHPANLFGILLKNPIAETFIKTENIKMLKLLVRNEKEFTRYWPSFKICRRHKFKIDDYSTWFDHMKLLEYFKYDLHNPKFICSPTFMKDHQRLVVKKRKIDERIYQEKMRLDKIKHEILERERIEKAEKDLIKYKKKYFDLNFIDPVHGINVVTLKSLKEFEEEETALIHCVYSSKYYEKNDSLILSARKGNQILETIEIDLDDMKIIQVRGYDNKNSKFHKSIVNLVKSNLKQIKQIA